jgi:hypothetical protein
VSSGRREIAALAAIVLAAFAVYGVLASRVEDPRIFVDENIYMDAASSLAHGDGLQVRGEHYGWAPGYPVALAPVLAASASRADAYLGVKLLNAFLFALAAVPIYLLARRMLSVRGSAVVALLSVAVPSSVYVGLVMTEGLAYLVAAIAIYALVRAVETPTVSLQLAALGAVVLAYFVRQQFAALFVAFILALAVSLVFDRRRARALLPTGVALAAVVAGALAYFIPRGASALGRYRELWRSYDPLEVGRWFVYHFADLALYFGLAPLVLLPAAVLVLYRRNRELLIAFASVTVCLLALTAAFSTTPSSGGRLHDRYLFYLVPIWLVTGAVWLRHRARLTLSSLAVGAALVVGAIAALPFDRLGATDQWRQFEAAGTPLWSRLGDWTISHGVTSHRMLGLLALVAVGVALLASRRAPWALAAILGAVFVANSAFLWEHGITSSHWRVFADRKASTLAWVDDAVPGGATVTMLDPGAGCSRFGAAYSLTEFYNDRVGPVTQLGQPVERWLPIEQVRVRPDGTLVRTAGQLLKTNWVILPPGVSAHGTRVREGTLAGLVLWRVPGVVTVGAQSDRQLAQEACAQA